MRYFVALIMVLTFSALCFAEHGVVLDKATGDLIQSSSKPEKMSLDDFSKSFRESSLRDIASMNKQSGDVEIKVISNEEFSQLWNDKVVAKALQKQIEKDAEINQKRESLKSKLKLSDEDMNALRAVMSN